MNKKQWWRQHLEDDSLACEGCSPVGQRGFPPGCPAGGRQLLRTAGWESGPRWGSLAWMKGLLPVWGAASPSASAAEASGKLLPSAPKAARSSWGKFEFIKNWPNGHSCRLINIIQTGNLPWVANMESSILKCNFSASKRIKASEQVAYRSKTSTFAKNSCHRQAWKTHTLNFVMSSTSVLLLV